MATKSLSLDLADKKIMAVAVDPGWTRTDMGGPDADISVETSAGAIANILEGLNDESQSGKYICYDGHILPW
jgi:NAD(P)-dependent dehydrogenase (short-subunit alcohol dehydrogenase family)